MKDYKNIAIDNTTSSDNKLYGKIGKLIKIIDDLRDLGLNEVFELPKICVLGTQSAGKSSVLESIIGLDCLPRGSGLVTRRPLELRLVHMHYSDNSEPWAEFEEIKNKKYFDFEKVKEEINNLTEKVAGSKGNIVNIPIKLRIYSKTCPDLTVIDLPGITRIPLHGSDQPENIEEVTKNMCKAYCQDKTTIILCVMQANVDISTSEALHMARQLDPKGDRTIGVLTKLDLMDPGTSAKNILEGNEVPLNHGYIALKNRSQKDLEDRIPIKSATEKEMLFFRSHSVYSKMNLSYFGIENLVDKLRRLFFDHLKLYLPGIYASLKDKISESKKCLDELGANDMNTLLASGNDMTYLNSLVNNFSKNVEDIFLGKSYEIEENKTAHVLKLLYYEFLENINKKPSEKIHNKYIIEIIVRSEGDRLSGFPESGVFYEILNEEYDMIKNEIQIFYEKIFEESMKAINKTTDKYFKHFPQLKEKMHELIVEFINKHFGNSKYICDSIAKMNMDYMYIDENDTCFQRTLMNILIPEEEDNNNTKSSLNNRNRNNASINKEKHSFKRSETEKNEDYNEKMAEYVKKLVDYYFDLTLRNLRESIPKAMAYNYIREFKNLRPHLLVQLVTLSNENLLQEDPLIANKRKYHYDILKILEKSEKLMLADEESENKANLEKIQNQFKDIGDKYNKRATINENNSKSVIYSGKANLEYQTNNDTSGRDRIESKNSNNNNNNNNNNNSYLKPTNSNNSRSNSNLEVNNANEKYSADYNNNINNHSSKDVNNKQHNESNDKGGPKVNLKMDFDPTTGELKGVRPDIKMSMSDAKSIYDANKKYIPPKEDILKGAKAAANYASEANDKYSSGNNTVKKDPLTNSAFSNLFGKKK